jgi:DNA transformation protein and related proteins
MSVSPDFHAYLLEQLQRVPRVTSRRMFGGVGVYSDGIFFAIIDDDVLYLKVDDSNRGDFEQRGMRPFCPYPDQPDKAMGYFAVPADVLEDEEDLAAWSRKAVQVALNAKRRPAGAARRSQPADKLKRRGTMKEP